jgi:hypothetical protein
MFCSRVTFMLRRGCTLSAITGLIAAAVLLACPRQTLAQRGAGSGHVGGGTASGGGLSGGGKPTGVDMKDDLKDFHEVLALQASSEQTGAYTAMIKSTAAAQAELRAFLNPTGKPGPASELATRGAALTQSIDSARTLNKRFLEGLSDRQKSGLKEITKKLTKIDSELAQQSQALDQQLRDPTKLGQLAGTGQSLEHTLDGFQNLELDLGKEMSIGLATHAPELTYTIPPVKTSIRVENQPVEITTSGVVSRGVAEAGQNNFALELTADLSDLQVNITQILRAQLNQADRCGERIAIQDATLSPSAPASLAFVRLHYERWACFGAAVNEMVEGSGTIEVKLSPRVGEDGKLRLETALGGIHAEGLVGELLRSGSLGDTVRAKVANSLFSSMLRAGDFKTTLPASAQENAALQRAEFQGTGSGRLLLVLHGEILVSNDKVSSVTSDFEQRSSSQTLPQLMPR